MLLISVCVCLCIYISEITEDFTEVSMAHYVFIAACVFSTRQPCVSLSKSASALFISV